MNASGYRVGRISVSELRALSAYRGLNGWSLCPAGPGETWLRVPFSDEEIFRKLPLIGRWTSDAVGLLVRDGRRVPENILPDAGWQLLSTYITVTMPLRTAPGMSPPTIEFQLEADESDRPATGVLCQMEVFATWVETAFAPRLECLRFACCEDGRAFVIGVPLPAIPGAGIHQLGKLWLPCGYRLPDHLWQELVEETLSLGNSRIAIVQPDGSHEDLESENLVSANRAAVRATMRGEHSII